MVETSSFRNKTNSFRELVESSVVRKTYYYYYYYYYYYCYYYYYYYNSKTQPNPSGNWLKAPL